jgi:hypothetical protein
MSVTYEARLVRQTKNYLVYEYGNNQYGNPFTFYVPKNDLPEVPPKVTKLTLEAA